MSKHSFIHTSGLSVNKSLAPLMKDIYDTTKTSLISLIDGLGSSNSGLDSIARTARDLQQYKLNYLQDSLLYVDSSGFHIVKGVIPAFSISKFINCYNYYLEKEYNTYDYIFSLDIASFINSPSDSTVENIYKLNEKSIGDSIDIIKNNLTIKSKYVFVLHFKDWKQYQVFDYLYDKLEVYKYSECFSIGGMVSLNGLCDSTLDFAPFIGPAYWALYQYIHHSDFKYPFKLHLLGVYWKSFRFMLFFLEKLFNKYLANYNQTCIITYDSVNYSITALYKAQTGFPCYNMENDLQEYDTIHDIPSYVIDQIYKTPEARAIFDENIALAKSNARLTNLNYLTNVNIYGQLQLDHFFEFLIDKHDLVQLVFNSDGNYNLFKNQTDYILNSWSNKYKCISNTHIKQIRKSLKFTYAFHNWLLKDQSKTGLDKHMETFIKKINFRYTLS